MAKKKDNFDVSFYKTKMSKEELESHLALATRARTFKDKKKENAKRACRGKFDY